MNGKSCAWRGGDLVQPMGDHSTIMWECQGSLLQNIDQSKGLTHPKAHVVMCLQGHGYRYARQCVEWGHLNGGFEGVPFLSMQHYCVYEVCPPPL